MNVDAERRPPGSGPPRYIPLLSCLALLAPGAASAVECSHHEQSLEGLPISSITIENGNIFDTEVEGQNLWIHRLANAIHIRTRKSTIDDLLLFDENQPYSEQLVEETERLIRSKEYIHDARIEAEPDCERGVELKVVSSDNWTLTPSVSVGSSGGETRTSVEIEEGNLLGLGLGIKLKSRSDEDRDENSISFRDSNWFGNHKDLKLTLSDNSDGYYYEARLFRPFFQLDSRFAWYAEVISQELERPIYTDGVLSDKVGERSDFVQVSFGWSPGLVEDSVARYRVGWTVVDTEYFRTDDFPQSEIPDSAYSSYPFFKYSLSWPKYLTLTNFLVMGVNEDVSIGDSIDITVGLKDEIFGSDQRGLTAAFAYNSGTRLAERTLGFMNLWFGFNANAESDDTGSLSLAGRLYHYRSQSHSYLLNGSIETSLNAEDFEQYVLGGDSGLKGYPIRYQKGDSKVTLAIEDRVYFDWYPLQLLKFGAAAFAEVGSAWSEGDGPDYIGDVGFGLRVVSTRQSKSKVLHADIAFPLSDRDQVDEYQLFLKAQAQF